MMIERCCAFTGHRPKKFPWRYNEADSRCVALKQALSEQIGRLVGMGFTDFFSGMAEGVDVWAAMAVLSLKKDNPALKLHSILPCEGQADGWSASARKLYYSILEQADEVVYVSQEYSKGCMLKRNRYMVVNANLKLLIFAEIKCKFSPVSTDVYTALQYNSTCVSSQVNWTKFRHKVYRFGGGFCHKVYQRKS